MPLLEEWSTYLIAGIAVSLVLLVAAIVGTRVYWTVRERRRAVIALLTAPLLMTIVDGEFAVASAQQSRVQLALGERLATMSREVRGTDRSTIALWLTENGYVERARRQMRSRQAPNRAQGVGLYLAATGGLGPEPVEALLHDRNARVRSTAARALGSVASTASIPALLAALISPRRPVARSVVAMAIVHMAPKSAADLAPAWTTGDVRVRSLAAEVSGYLGLADARPELELGLLALDRELRLTSARALGRIASPSSLPALRAALAGATDADELRVLRAAAEQTLEDDALAEGIR